MVEPIAIGAKWGVPVELFLGIDRQQRALPEPVRITRDLRWVGRVEEIGMGDSRLS
ncbi:hypothetical protein N6L26_02495 [Qipengyuania sp. SS22]|uniref:hypothetical protein n=1 Tax=Qipengyuania sp. SS22 TaxID=2979461 RepID=UPI0021E566BD|nr:hypothetical protein [Qipengyuania sp. SS22]UYH55455.1 hypothetical protein N6L26_02495 [Qipengyuania sp. SS22]